MRRKSIISFAILLCLGLISQSWAQVYTYTTAGTSNLTVPAGAVSATIQCLGAGGGGGSGNSTDSYTAGGGGGGGAFSTVTVSVIPGDLLSITVGAGGTAPNGSNGNNGGASQVSLNGTMVASAQGGFGGANGPGGFGGASGIGFLYRGGNGGNSLVASYSTGGGGGGAAGSTSAGNPGANGSGTNSNALGGTGGTGGFTSGTGGNGCYNWNSCGGSPGGQYGAGGGGGCSESVTPELGWGGAGYRGKVVVTICSLQISSQPSTATQNICLNGASTALSVVQSGGTGYQWYSNTAPSNSGGTIIPGATASSYTPPTNVAGVRYYYCVVTNAPCTVVSNVSGGVYVQTASISTSGTTILCGGGSITLTATAPGASAYLWSTGATTSAITVTPVTNTTYTVTVTSTCGAVVGSIPVAYSPPVSFSATVTTENITGWAGFSGETFNLNAYPVQGTLVNCGFNGSLTGSIGGTWVTNTSGTATDPCCTAMPAFSLVASSTLIVPFGVTPTVYPWEGSGFISFNSGTTSAGNRGFLRSASFSTVGYTGIIVDFAFMQFVNSACGESMTLEYSINGGGVWVPMGNYPRGGASTQCPSWKNFSAEMPPGAIGQPNVMIRFNFLSSGSCFCGQDMFLDAVRVTGVTTPGGYAYFSNYFWSTSGTYAPGVAIVNPFIRSTTTADLNDQTNAGYIDFFVQLIDANGCVYRDTCRVNINPNISGINSGNIPTAVPPSVCPGGSSVVSVSGTGNLQWQQSVNGGPWTNIGGSTTVTSVTINNITQTTCVRAILTGGGFVNGACSDGTQETPPVCINVAAATIPANVTVCTVGGSVTLTPTLSYITPGTYQWQISLNGGATWTDIPGATGFTYSPAITTGTEQYRLVISNAVSPPACTIITNFTVAALANYGTIPSVSETICDPSAITMITPPNVPGATSYTFTWFMSPSIISPCPTSSTGLTQVFTETLPAVYDSVFLPTVTFDAAPIGSIGAGLGGWNEVTQLASVNNWAIGASVPIAVQSLCVRNGVGNYYEYLRTDDCEKIAYYGTAINAANADNVRLSFSYKCVGQRNTFACTPVGNDHGHVVYAIGAPANPASWIECGGPYWNQNLAVNVVNMPLPTAVDGQNFYIGFKWYNDNITGSCAPGLPFMVDNVSLIATVHRSPVSTYDPPVMANADETYVLQVTAIGGVCNNVSNLMANCANSNCTSPLPIELLNFNAFCHENQILLAWSTASESDNDYFEIQRSSDNSDWQVLKTVDGAGNSSVQLNYSLTDNEPYSGLSYYRLRQVDYNGIAKTFSPVSVICKPVSDGPSVSYYPNPFTSEIIVDIINVDFDNATIELYDMLGKLVYSIGVVHNGQPSDRFTIDPGNIPAGIYSIRFSAHKFTRTSSIIKVY